MLYENNTYKNGNCDQMFCTHKKNTTFYNPLFSEHCAALCHSGLAHCKYVHTYNLENFVAYI